MTAVRVRRETDHTPRWQHERNLAEHLGWECVPDAKRGNGWCSFRKGDVHVWQGRYWVRARLIGDTYRFHQLHQRLSEALRDENGIAFGPDSNPRRYVLSVSFKIDQNRSRERLRFLRDTCERDEFVLIGCAEGAFGTRRGANEWWDNLRHTL